MHDGAASSHPAVQAQLDRIGTLPQSAAELGLGPVIRLLDRLGNPQRALPPVLHVAGTNGKGSTCAFLRAAIEAAGHSVHVYTSPHLVRLNERTRLAGTLIDDAALALLLEEVIDRGGDIGASFFETTTAATLLAFSRAPADACIVEVGLGGRIDATNVFESPLVTGIAQLGVDHPAILGRTLEAVAAHKAGIARRGAPLVTMAYPSEIARVIADAAAAAGTRVIAAGDAWRFAVADGRLRYADASGTLEIATPVMPGAHQAENLALAIAMLRHQDRLPVGEDAFAAAARTARWPARMQRLRPGPLTALLPAGSKVWLDGGHNPSAANVVRSTMAREGLGITHIVFGLLSTKNPGDMLAPFADSGAAFRMVPVPHKAHHAPEALAAFARERGIAAETAPDAGTALRAIAAEADPASPPRVLILGSLYLAGEILALNDEAPD
ncbi:MAG: bifunctional folylpolyglutamate synthase/dihydrofolate synthase [Pseudomonadota bacterium]